MTPTQIALVQASWQKVDEKNHEVAQMFYQRLFELAPELRQFYQTDLKECGARLMRNLGMAVTSLGRMDSVMPMLQDFAAQRVEHGIKDGYETVVRNAMLCALEQRLAESFTQDVRTAWNETYSLLTGIIGRDSSASLVGEFVD
jgi:hemoglobin-like flavoprotein